MTRLRRLLPGRPVLLALLLVALLLPTAAHADDEKPAGKDDRKSAATVGIRTANAKGGDDRGVFDYEILPRGVVQDWIAVSNFRYEPITVRLFGKDATSSADSAYDIQPSAEEPTDLGSWISLKRDKVTIPPRTEIVVPFQLGVPHDATPGDHSGAIVVSLLAKEPKAKGGIVVDHRIGMRIHLRVPGALKPALRVEDLKVSWNGGADLLGKGDATVSYTLRNTGNVRMGATGGVELSRALGMPSVDLAVPPVEDLLPGGVTRVTAVAEDVLGTGPMTAQVDLRGVPTDEALQDEAIDVAASQSFSAWPWLLMLLVAGVLLLLGAGGWYERRRRKARKAAAADLEAAEAASRANAKHRMLVRSALAVLAVAGVLVPGALSPATAKDGDQWRATISKKEGVALEPFDIETSGGCPLPATGMVGFGYGRGFPKSGAVVLSNTEGNVTNETGFTAALVDSMKNIMALQPDPRGLAGTYKFVIRCIKPEFPDKSYGEYVAAIRFDRPDHWVALPPLTDKKGPVAQIPSTGPNGEPKTVPGAGGSATPGAGAGNQGGTGPGAVAGSVSADADTAAAESGSSTRWPLLVGGIAIGVASLALAFGRRIPGPWRRG